MFRVAGDLKASLRFGTQAIFSHQAGNATLATGNTLLFECLINAEAAIGLCYGLSPAVWFWPILLGSGIFYPSVVVSARGRERVTHDRDGELRFLLLRQAESRFAFFKMSRSIFRCWFSSLKRLSSSFSEVCFPLPGKASFGFSPYL